MTKVEKLEVDVQQLTALELAALRAWFEEFDLSAWDAQLNGDIESGRLQFLADEALQQHSDGQARAI